MTGDEICLKNFKELYYKNPHYCHMIMIIEMRISPACQIFIEVYWKNLKNAAMGDYEGQSVASLVAKSQLPTPPKKHQHLWVPYNVRCTIRALRVHAWVRKCARV